MCECYKIGGRFIAEDPDCPVHGIAAQQERAEQEREDRALRDEIESLKTRIEQLEYTISQMPVYRI